MKLQKKVAKQEEHWDIKDNKLAGLWTINAKAAKGADIWQKLDEVIGAYTRVHPLEVAQTIQANVEQIKENTNDTNSSKGGTLRWGASVPAGLLFQLQFIEPDLFTNKTLFHKFLRKYKGFAVCSRV